MLNPKVSAVVLSKNNQDIIVACLKSLNWCDEIVLIDDNSSDETVNLASQFSAKVYKRNLAGDYSKQRNFGLSKAKYEWVLFVDSDEIISTELSNEILNSIANSKFNGYYLKRVNYFNGLELKGGEWASTYLIRLAKKGKGKWQRSVHEKWQIKQPVGRLINVIEHHQNKSITNLIADINRYSSRHADELLAEGKKPNYWKILLFPPAKFINNFVFKQGFLDGTYGFLMAVVMSFHGFLAWSKLWMEK